MKITVTDGVEWDTTQNQQSDAAMNWLRENVITRMGTKVGEFDKTEPEFDAHNRPYEWCITMPTCLVTITREYVKPNSSSWALRKDTVIVTPKTE